MIEFLGKQTVKRKSRDYKIIIKFAGKIRRIRRRKSRNIGVREEDY